MALKKVQTEIISFRMSAGLRSDFQAVCQEEQLDFSDKLRELVSQAVESRRRRIRKANASVTGDQVATPIL